MTDTAICFDQVEKGFGARKVLDKVSFSVARGEAICVLGRSGTGKSVTLKLMIGLLFADAGKVMVAGEDMSTLDEDGLAKVRRKMGYLFQSAALFDSFNVSQNLAMPLHRLDGTKSPEEIKRLVVETL
jgi:phospholipid/cholesterol/gamma-HCH transport system ATP-binding protein